MPELQETAEVSGRTQLINRDLVSSLSLSVVTGDEGAWYCGLLECILWPKSSSFSTLGDEVGGSLRQLREGRWTEATTLKSKPYRTRDYLQRMAKVIAATGLLLPSTKVNKKKNLNFSKVSFQSG